MFPLRCSCSAAQLCPLFLWALQQPQGPLRSWISHTNTWLLKYSAEAHREVSGGGRCVCFGPGRCYIHSLLGGIAFENVYPGKKTLILLWGHRLMCRFNKIPSCRGVFSQSWSIVLPNASKFSCSSSPDLDKLITSLTCQKEGLSMPVNDPLI